MCLLNSKVATREEDVGSANSTNQFKSHLDHYWIKNGYGFSQA